MQNFEGKTIVLGAPKHFNFDKVIERELRGLGFSTVNISFYNANFKYKHLLQRLECFFCRDFLGMDDYKSRLRFKASQKWLEGMLEKTPQADYALLIRPDVYSVDFINSLRMKAKKLIGYQWDGLDRYPHVHQRIGLFDRFFVFDGEDLGVQSVLPITNYYLEAISEHLRYDKTFKSDVLYTGTYSRHHIDLLGRLITNCRVLGQNVHYHLHHKRKTYIEEYDLRTNTRTLDYAQNVKYAFNTKIILDFVNPSHRGLSFRFFEALRFEKKIITTNSQVKQYDFYHPNNVLVWENNNIEELEEFIHKPYVPLPEKISNKYSFRNWLQYALDEGEYERLSVPC